MNEITIKALRRGEEKSIRVPAGQSLLKSIRAMGFSLRALCGERGTCGSCKVKVTQGELAPGSGDRAFFSETDLEAGWRLSCMAYPEADIGVELNADGEEDFNGVIAFQLADGGYKPLTAEIVELAKSKDSIAVQTQSVGKLGLSLLQAAGRMAAEPDAAYTITRYGGDIVSIDATPKGHYAIGVDIGTTTLGFALVDLRAPGVIGRLSMVNRQREYGADVVTRIVKAKGGELPLLSGTIRAQLAEGAARLCREYGVESGRVIKVAVAGNTTMLHLLLGLNCDLLGKYPFTPVTLERLSVPWKELFSGELSCPVDILPGISTYVGADITAGLLYLDMHKSERPEILLDIGTNGEMALARDGKLLCTSTAAGPALEGVNITWGTGSVPGAISSIQYEGGAFTCATIGGQPPVGICGSGVIEGIFRFLEHGLMNRTGRFQGEYAAAGAVIAKTAAGEDIFISQKDVREVQLAKSAIRSGVDLLIRRAGLSCGDIETLYIAGGFGVNIDFRSGVGIGLVPPELEGKIKVTGNTSLGGVVSYLVDPRRAGALDEIIQKSSEFSLSEDEDFEDLFIENMSF
ncbi:MAG: ASKHA domain-containing protein [Clostridiales bacterium]|nr:ASKHA domain-containing protein [Clostridiales bacterium]